MSMLMDYLHISTVPLPPGHLLQRFIRRILMLNTGECHQFIFISFFAFFNDFFSTSSCVFCMGQAGRRNFIYISYLMISHSLLVVGMPTVPSVSKCFMHQENGVLCFDQLLGFYEAGCLTL